MDKPTLAWLLHGMAAPTWMAECLAAATDSYKIASAVGTIARLWLPQNGTDAVRVAGLAGVLDTPQMRADKWWRARPVSVKHEVADGIHECVVYLDTELGSLVTPAEHVVWCERRDEVSSAGFMLNDLAVVARLVKELRELDTRAMAVVPVPVDLAVNSPRLAAVKRLDVDKAAWWASWVPTSDEE